VSKYVKRKFILYTASVPEVSNALHTLRQR